RMGGEALNTRPPADQHIRGEKDIDGQVLPDNALGIGIERGLRSRIGGSPRLVDDAIQRRVAVASRVEGTAGPELAAQICVDVRAGGTALKSHVPWRHQVDIGPPWRIRID